MKQLMDSCGLEDASNCAVEKLPDQRKLIYVVPKWEISEIEVVSIAIEHDNQGDLQMQSISFLHKNDEPQSYLQGAGECFVEYWESRQCKGRVYSLERSTPNLTLSLHQAFT